jgi:hypothetical protein
VRIRGLRDLDKEWHWRNVISDWDASGLNGAQYCRERGITYSQFRDWRIEIEKRDNELAKEAREPVGADKHRIERHPARAEESNHPSSAERGNPIERTTERDWRKLLADWLATGLSGAEYCRRKGIRYTQFADWRKRIKQIDAKANGIMRSAKTQQRRIKKPKQRMHTSLPAGRQPRSVEFAEVKVVDGQVPDEAEPCHGGDTAAVDIILPSGITLRLSAGCSLSFLSSIISVLENR